MHTLIFRLLALFCCAAVCVARVSAQCTMIELPIGERFRQARLVVEGTITGATVFRNPANAMIFTAYRIAVRSVIKSAGAPPREAEFIAEGGTLGSEAVTVSPALSVGAGTTAIFFLTDPPPAPSFAGELPERYGLFGWSQGAIILEGSAAHDVFATYSADGVRAALTAMAGKKAVDFAPVPVPPVSQKLSKAEKPLAAAISSISPVIITGGTFDTLTINGSGFGASYTGSARIAFRSADDGGSTTINAPGNHIVSWTDAQIRVRVPPGAGTGTVRVTAVDNTQATSAQTLTVYYSLINAVTGGTYLPSYLAANGGGYVVQFSATFFNNQPAVNAVRRALTTWRCGTFINITPTYAPTSVTCYNGTDGVCMIGFTNTGCSTPAGILAVTYNFWTTCNGTNWNIREFDMLFADPAPFGGWNYGPGATTGGRFDMESVALHEIGHAHQLGHIIEGTKVMNYSIGMNTDRRSLGQQDLDGGTNVMSRASAVRPCAPSPIIPLTPATCQLPIAPEAAFSGSALSGCAPLTVQFTDQSANEPTTWQWDINNDGTTDYTMRNPAHTYTVPGAYSVRLTATNLAGTSSLTRTNYITVLPRPAANAGADAAGCYGTSLQLGGSPSATGGTPGYTYLWSGAGAAFLNATTQPNPVMTLNFSGTMQCVLAVTDANFCSSRDTVVITAYPQLFANAGTDRQFCAGGSTVIGATPSGSGGRAPLLFSWSPGNSLSDSTAQRPVAAPAQTTDYILTVRDGNNCIVRDTVRVTIFPAPLLDVGRDTTVCAGTPRLLGGAPTASAGAPPFVYSWQPAAGLSSAISANPVAAPDASTRYILTVTDANNCQWRDTVLLTILPAPSAIILPSRSPVICAGDTITLDAGVGYAGYRWSTGATTQTIKVWEAGAYNVEVTNAARCTAAASNPVVVTVNQRPDATISGPNSACVNSTAVYSALPETGVLYEWTPSGGSIVSGQGQQQVSVRWTGTNGSLFLKKTYATTGCAATGTLGVAIAATLKPVLTAAKTEGCEGDSIVIDAPAGYETYRWSTGATGQRITVTKSGAYTLSVTDRSACSGISDPMTITIYPPPVKPLVNRRGDTLFSTPADAYQWKKQGAVLPGQTRQFLPVSELGGYSVTIWDARKCTAESSEYTVGSLSGVREADGSGVRIYPNPFDDAGFTIDCGGIAAVFEVFSAAGVRVAGGSLDGSPAALTLADAPAGAYLAVVRFGGETRYAVLTKVR